MPVKPAASSVCIGATSLKLHSNLMYLSVDCVVSCKNFAIACRVESQYSKVKPSVFVGLARVDIGQVNKLIVADSKLAYPRPQCMVILALRAFGA